MVAPFAAASLRRPGYLVRRCPAERQHSGPARIRDRSCQRMRHSATHRREHDRGLDTNKVTERRPHGSSLGSTSSTIKERFGASAGTADRREVSRLSSPGLRRRQE